MSETLIPSPYEFDSPEGRAERNAQLRGAGIAATSLLPAWLTQVTPYRVDPQGEGHWQPPGGVLGAYSGVGTLAPMATNYLLGKAGISARLPAFPGAEEAGRQYEETRDMAFRTIPHMEPQNADEQTIQDLAFSGAGMAVPGASIVQGLAGKFGRVPGMAAHMSIPSVGRGGGAAVGVGLTGGAETYQQYEQDELAREMGVDPAKLRLQRGEHDLAQPDTSHQVAHPQQGAAANVPFHTNSIPTIDLVTPQYGVGGEREIGWGEALLYVAGIAAGAKGLMKYGGKPLDFAWKTVAGQGDQLNTPANVAAHNAQIAELDAGRATSAPGSPDVSGAARGEAPLPGKAGRVGTNVAQSLWDSNRVLKETAIATQPSKLVGERLAADIGTTNGTAAMPIRIAEQMATGVNQATGNVLPKVKELVQKYDNLTPDRAKVWEDGMNASHELNERNLKRVTASRGGRAWTDEQIRYNYRDTPTETLEAQRRAMLADPELSAMADHAHSISMTNYAEGVAQGRMSSKNYIEFLRDRPHYVPPTNVEGHIDTELFRRTNNGVGWQTPPGRVIDSIVEHYGKLYEKYAQNTVTDNLIQQMDSWHKADPVRNARLVTEVAPFAKGRVITVWREGVAHSYEIENSNLYRAMQNNHAQTSVYLNSADAFRRSMQSGTTGVAATVLAQRPFALISLLRNIPQIATDRLPGTRFGAIDRGMQNLTGGKIGSRIGLDPTQYLGSFDQALRGSAAVTAKNLSDLLRNPANPITKLLKAQMGNQWVEGAATRMEHRYVTSQIAEHRARGVTGGGGGGVYDPRTFNVNVSRKSGYNPLADQVPGVFHPDGIEIPYTKIAIPGTKGAVSTYINLRTMMRDIHQAIADGGNAYYYKQNPHLSPNARVIAAREVIGDPSVTGSSRFIQGAGQHVAYFNPSVQDMVRTMRNLRDNPVASISGMVTTLSIVAAASLLTAMLGGEKHLNVLEQQMTAYERASNAVFFHDMGNEHNFTIFSLPQKMRVFFPAIMELIAYGSGAFQLRAGEELYDRVIHSLADMFSHLVSNSTLSAILAGVGSFADVAQVPVLWETALGVAGYKSNPPLSTMLQNQFVENKPITEGLITEINKPPRIPGRQQNSYISKDDNSWMQRLFSNINGLAGHAMYDAVTQGWARATSGAEHAIADAMDGLVGQAGQSWRDNAPFGNMVWGNNVKMSYRNPMADSFDNAMNKMEKFPKGADIYASGYTRSGGEPAAQTGNAKVNSDPVIRQMLTYIGNTHARLVQTVQPQINDLRAQLRQIDEDPHLDKDTQRRLHNQQVSKLNNVYARGDLELNEMHSVLSQLVGGKHVNVNSFDFAKGLEQFHD